MVPILGLVTDPSTVERIAPALESFEQWLVNDAGASA